MAHTQGAQAQELVGVGNIAVALAEVDIADIAVLEGVVEAAMLFDTVLDNLSKVVPGMPEYYGVANVNIEMELASDAGPAYIRRWIV